MPAKVDCRQSKSACCSHMLLLLKTIIVQYTMHPMTGPVHLCIEVVEAHEVYSPQVWIAWQAGRSADGRLSVPWRG